MWRGSISEGVNRYSWDGEGFRGSDDAEGDLAAVSDEELGWFTGGHAWLWLKEMYCEGPIERGSGWCVYVGTILLDDGSIVIL